MNAPETPRLTSLSHGGGCGCKIAPDVLARLMRDALPAGPFPDLLVGAQSSDDAAVYRLNAEQALVATTDFFMPIVDDPFDFGRIAATNALSDIYAMGGKPILALALVGMPIGTLPHETINAILKGGASVCAAAGIPIGGGHSIDSIEPIYGLAALGLVHPDRVLRNDGARAGDVLILGKPLGVGIYSAAGKQGRLSPAAYADMLAVTTALNTPGPRVAALPGVHAMTDVTGFALLGHLLELCRGSGVSAELRYASLPWLPEAASLAAAGVRTGASARNWNACQAAITMADGLPAEAQTLLCDPQTSGGLLIACRPEAATPVLDILQGEGFGHAAVIGTLGAGPAAVRVV